MSSTFLTAFKYFYEFATSENGTKNETCEEHIDHYKFYQFSLIPAILMCCLFGASKTRRQILLNKLGGRPGLVYPMDTLTRSHSFSYACSFGVTAFVVYEILVDQKFAIDYSGPIALQSLIAMVSMFIYGIVFFPVFASLALGTAVSYGLGTLYVWMFFIVDVYKLTECKVSTRGHLLLVIRDVPNLLCLAYLGISLPVRFVIAIRQKQYFSSPIDEKRNETLFEIRASYQGIHVRDLLNKPVRKPLPTGKVNVFKRVLKNLVHRYIYHRKRGFEFPSRLVSVMFVAGCVVYVITVEFLVFFVNLFSMVLNVFTHNLDTLKWQDQPGDTDLQKIKRAGFLAGYFVTYVVKVSTLVSISVASLISLMTILHMMTSFRKNLYALYRGDFRNIPDSSETSAMALCVGSMKYAGYQVAYIFWAYVLSCVVLFIGCIVLAVPITLLASGYTDWLVYTVLQVWPGFLIAVVLYLAQMCVAKYFFLQNKGQYLRLDNRRVYFIFTYFMFFFNIFMGLASCLMRILKAIAIGIIFLARLDNSTLPRSFEFFDPGFSAYQGFIHMEAAHTHPVVNVFVRLLSALTVARREGSSDVSVHVTTGQRGKMEQQSKPGQKRRISEAAIFKWHVTYTLLHNPMIRIYRKGYIQALRKAREEGIKIPISDKLFTDFDLVKSREQRERERLEELERISLLKRSDEEFEIVSPDSFDLRLTEINNVKENVSLPQRQLSTTKVKYTNTLV